MQHFSPQIIIKYISYLTNPKLHLERLDKHFGNILHHQPTHTHTHTLIIIVESIITDVTHFCDVLLYSFHGIYHEVSSFISTLREMQKMSIHLQLCA